MSVIKLKENIFSIGANHWDRKLFDELIPLPEGTSYNAYLIKGSQKVALIDTVDPSCQHILIENLKRLNIKNIDFIISNHAEQDHSGAIPELLKLYPSAKVVTNIKCKDFLKDLLLIPDEKFIVINDRETLSLGNKTLQFVLTPWVHWPETMVTYLLEDKILFSCDFFGSHLATSELYVENEELVKVSAKRYYAEIMMPFRNVIKTNLEKISEFKIDIIAPSHGPVYNNPEFIINLYKDWISDKVKNEVVLAYVSMHGSTKKIVEYLIDELIERKIKVLPFNLTVADIGELAISIVDAATVLIAAPTFLTGPHPSAFYFAYILNSLRPKTKFISIVSSYGWGSKIIEKFESVLTNLNATKLNPVLIKGYPKENDFQMLKKLTDEILTKHRELNII